MVGTAGADSISGIVDFAAGRTEGAKSTFNTNDTVDGGAGADTLTLTVQNASAATANVAGTVGKATVIQVVAATAVGATASDNSLQVQIGTQTISVAIATDETVTNIASAIVNAVNNGSGAVIAVKGAVTSGVFAASSTGTVVQITNGSVTEPLTGITVSAVKGITGLSQSLTQGFVKEIAAVDASVALALPAGTTANIETININNTTGQNVNGDASNFVGATTFFNTSKAAGNDVTLTNVDFATQTIGLAGRGNITVTSKSGLVTDGTVSLAVNATGGTARDTFTITSNTSSNQTFKTVNIDAVAGSSRAEVVGTAAATATTVNITGAGSLNLTGAALLDNATVVNAASNTGGVTVDLSGNTVNVTATGGAGNDTFTFAYGQFNSLDKVDGGAGTNTLALTGVTASQTISTASSVAAGSGRTVADAIVAAKNISALSLTSANAVTVNVGQLGLKNYTINQTGNVLATLTNTANDTVVTVGTSNAATGDITVTGASGVSASTVIMGGSATAAATVDVLTFTTPIVDVALVSNGTSATGNTIATLTGIAGAKYTLTGSQDLTITNALSQASTFDGAAFTGELAITGSSGADTITGGKDDDVITMSAGVDVIDLSAGGNDTITFTNKNQITNTIKGFTISGSDADVVKFVDATTDLDLVGTKALSFTKGSITEFVAGTVTATTANNIIVITGAVEQTAAAIQKALVDIHAGASALGTDGIIVISANSTGNANVWFDADGATASATAVKLAEFDGITLANLADLTSANFLVA